MLLLNPAVSLFNSVQILDDMYDRHVPTDPAGAQAFVDRVFASFADVYTREQETNFDGDFLYRAYDELEPGRDALETLIGTSFRYSLVNLAFTSDVMSRGGYMVPRDAELDRHHLAHQPLQARLPPHLRRLRRRALPPLLPGARPLAQPRAGDRRGRACARSRAGCAAAPRSA